jgi:hypothetical protein
LRHGDSLVTVKKFWGIDYTKRKKQEKVKEDLQGKPKNKWVTFTYVDKETRYITKLFKDHNVHIALRTNNSLEKKFIRKRT